MHTVLSTMVVMRRRFVQATAWGLAGGTLGARAGRAAPRQTQAPDDTQAEDHALVLRLLGSAAVDSPRVQLDMPPVFANGYSVPLSLAVDSPMTEADHVRQVHVLAPRNPIIVAARFHFTPQCGRVAVATRVRLAQPQSVLAVAEMNDGALLMTRAWVMVTTNGCA